MLQDQFRLLTNGPNGDKYRLKRRQKKVVWSWVREEPEWGELRGSIAEFDTIYDAHMFLLDNFAASVEEEVWTIVEDINLKTLVSSTNGTDK